MCLLSFSQCMWSLVIGACGQGLCTRVMPYDLCQYRVYVKQSSIHYFSHQAIIYGKNTHVYVCLITQTVQELATGPFLSG